MARKKPTFRSYHPDPPPAARDTPDPYEATIATLDTTTASEPGWTEVKPTEIRASAPQPAVQPARAPRPAMESEVMELDEMNAQIPEHFSRMKIPNARSPYANRRTNFAPAAIRHYVEQSRLSVNTNSWLAVSEVPTSDEILDTDNAQGREVVQGTISIPTNHIDGPWASKERYLESHYELLREDTILPLREAVGRVRTKPWAREEEYGNTVGVYENTRIINLTFAPKGIAARVQFSLRRSGKRIHWEQSKRLVTGSLVALSPDDDMFRTRCVMAIVAGRPLAGLEQNPPELDLYFARSEEFEVDPGLGWVMVEERSSYFEANRYTLLALQKLMREPFPLSEHLIGLQRDVEPPSYRKVGPNPHMDLSSIFGATATSINAIDDWPESPNTELDKTQLKALHRMLTKRLAIVQGPPGTGKTHVSVVALKALLSNMTRGQDPPIIVSCQTNHALDQLLRHVAEFEPDFARLGGRTRDRNVVKKRTLYEIKQSENLQPLHGGLKVSAINHQKQLARDIRNILAPLELGASFLTHKLLHKAKILTEGQYKCFEKGDTEWINHTKSQYQDQTGTENPVEEWIGKNCELAERSVPDEFIFEYEEVDLEFEQLKEMETENAIKDDEDFETLRGIHIKLADNFIGKESTSLNGDQIRVLSQTENVYQIKDRHRGAVYNYWKRQLKQKILQEFRPLAQRYQEASIRRTTGKLEEDFTVLKQQKIIGMTTTGFSKYRALVSALAPKVVLIEEAAETLEAPVTAACIPSLQQLILVGDHQQLRPHCQVQVHEDAPFNLNVSLFERLVKNDIEYDTLRRQRRMIPEIRRLLKPIYGNLIKDHPSVEDPNVRPQVSGMGGTNSFFFTHEWSESKDAHMSTCNDSEADMVVNFYDYLYMNGAGFSDITVLTFYNGQRKQILRKLRSHPNLQGAARDFRVVTVDSYQGEENNIVLLSLVRSNNHGQIGFLNIDNRVCVALSRAKCGLYMFGNGELLAGESKTWAEVITVLYGKRQKPVEKTRIGYYLPLTCVNHQRKTFVSETDDWELVNGGCEIKCRDRLPCGHICPLRCHPFSHESVNCMQKCQRILTCGHVCAEICGNECRCSTCVRVTGAVIRPGVKPVQKHKQDIVQPPHPAQHARGNSDSSGPGAAAWNSFSQNAAKHDAQAFRESNARYQQRQAENDRRRIAALEADMERSIFDDSYRSAASTGLSSMGRSSNGNVPTLVGRSLIDTGLDCHGTVVRHKFEETFVTGDAPKKTKEISLIDLD